MNAGRPTAGGPPPAAPPSSGLPPGQNAPWAPQPYGEVPGQQGRSDSNVLSILAMVFGGLAVIVIPILFGPVAIVLAYVARSRQERLAGTAMKVAIGGMLLGFIVGLLVNA